MEFDVTKIKNSLIEWTREWFAENGPGCKAVIGISGGKDSSVCAAVCVEALGRDQVLGVLIPDGIQSDIGDSRRLVEHLGIPSVTVNIADAVAAVHAQLRAAGVEASEQTRINLPPRIRMSVLYAVSQSVNGRVINTCNLSEDWVGYSTRYGDSAGDVSLLGKLTVREVRALGHALGLPEALVDKTPSDGLCGSSDEQKLGFSYAVLDRYIREGFCEDAAIRAKIDRLYRQNRFKLEPLATFPSGLAEHTK